MHDIITGIFDPRKISSQQYSTMSASPLQIIFCLCLMIQANKGK